MTDTDNEMVEKNYKELSRAFQDLLSWKWDSRFEVALAEFDVADKDNILSVLDRHLKSAWNSSNIDKAPPTVKKVNINLGKLRSGQMLFTSDAALPAYLYCAWWPWGNGKTISIRIAPCYKRLPEPEKAEKIERFKSCFGI